ncbi:FadR/GntR family transcriptional regulator [Desulfofustis glycolicus]|uniref:GntR family transcriptional regulator, transcriptional repressor for pyruvate dehydrogenase complex n=1 Tax=Desulfofustis glycolicus DSM 9705 TaxID=1121409 RepID=A0A1M5UUW5_9BACT|nr:FadR/GntR family transcriptional regulator [Desulfofustis glycolicus]MCB2215868.1 FadR family transcriptional regulator [Desulfobulbaceae bacterium]SHH66771.1 GntR family transcriptional regulator, transcriptional repressor for pyruvate dehydrogenase complex [Desulfofustis glycolicus DSM 9705]
METTAGAGSPHGSACKNDLTMADTTVPLHRKRLADQVADRLMSMIAEGVWQPGDRLPPEPELMKQFQVGRSSIREAVGALSLIGLVTVRPGQGTHVAPFSAGDQRRSIGLLGIGRDKIRELVEARLELECTIVRLAAARATTEDLETIREAHLSLRIALQNGESPIAQDLAFHLAVAGACHNSVLIRFLKEMRQPIRSWMEQKARHSWGYDRVFEQHETIITAIEHGNGATAEQALKSHLHATSERLVTAILTDG